MPASGRTHPDEWLIEADWPAPASVRAFTTLRTGPGVSLPPFDSFNLGSRSGDEPRCVAQNRARLARDFGLPSAPCWLHQVHGTEVARFDEAVIDAEATELVADASVTSRAGRVLAVMTADCIPVVFCNAAGTEVAAAHAGWPGLSAGVLEATVHAMDSAPETLLAWLGPGAGPHAYEVDAPVRDAFLARSGEAASAFIPTRPGHWLADLHALARQRLAAVGVGRVFGGDLCTISDPLRFYSYRREGRTGRMATLIHR